MGRLHPASLPSVQQRQHRQDQNSCRKKKHPTATDRTSKESQKLQKIATHRSYNSNPSRSKRGGLLPSVQPCPAGCLQTESSTQRMASGGICHRNNHCSTCPTKACVLQIDAVCRRSSAAAKQFRWTVSDAMNKSKTLLLCCCVR